MSNRDDLDTDKKTSGSPEPTSWRQKHGAMLLLAGFALLTILMVVMQKRAMR